MKIALILMVPLEQNRSQAGIGIAYLKSYALANEPGLDIRLFLNIDDFEATFNPQDYDMVGLSSVSYCFGECLDIARKVRAADPKIPILVGGSHISGFSKSILHDCFDVGVIGEGEVTFLELIRVYKKYKKFSADVLGDIKGICFSDKGEAVFTGYRDYIKNIDEIPRFDKSFLKQYNAIPFTQTSRGCPFNCKYCNSCYTWQSKLRLYSPDYVVQDIMELRGLYPDDSRIIFRDDTFTANSKVLKGIKNNLERINEEKRVSFIGSSHVNYITPEMGQLLREINVIKLNFGIESGSERLMRIVKRNCTSLSKVNEALDVCYDNGIHVGSSFIIGLPEETEEDLHVNYQFILEKLHQKKIFTAGTLILTPLPADNSDYWQIAMKKYNIDHLHFDWKRLDFRSWHLYHFENNMQGSIHDWWQWRNNIGALFIGGIPEHQWLKLIEPYETEMRQILEERIKEDRMVR